MSTTVAELVRARADDDNVGLLYGDRSWTWREVVAEASVRASWLREVLDPARPPHVGALLPNVPEYAFLVFGSALAGACVVGLNTTRRGSELDRDIVHTACQFVIADAEYAALLDDPVRVEAQPWAAHRGAALPDEDPVPSTLLCLLLTSGSTSAPKAARCSQRRMAAVAAAGFGFGPRDTLYCPMPLSHGNALSAALFPALGSGARLLLRDRFSATSWLDDVRSHDVTFTNTVGRALGYVLATAPTPHDRDHRLKVVLAPEASPRDMAAFKERFGVSVLSGYGSSEGGIVLMPSRKPGSLGSAPPGADIAVVDSSGAECERAEIDSDGRLLNAERSIGELVRRDTRGSFEGYWDNADADAERLRGGFFWSGDLAYRDADDVFFFAGRVGDWLRVDSENFSASPVERILGRYDPVAAVAVIGVPDPLAGDQVLAALELQAGRSFNAAEFADFLATQTDLGTKWAPRFVRIVAAVPVLGNGKIDKKPLRRDAWLGAEPVWWKPPGAAEYALMTDADRDAVRAQFVDHDRMGAFPSGDH